MFNETINHQSKSTDLKFYHQFVIIAYSIIFILSTVGNIFLCIAIFKQRNRRHSSARLFILNLAIADLITSFSIPFVIPIVILVEFPFGDFMCKAVYSVRNWAVYATALNLVAISYDRSRAIRSPLTFGFSKTSTLKVIFTLWFIALIAVLPQWINLQVQDYHNNSYCIESWQTVANRQAYSISMAMLFYFLPLLSICVFNISIISAIHYAAKHEINHKKIITRSKKRIAILMAVICIMFFSCYALTYIIIILTDFSVISLNPFSSSDMPVVLISDVIAYSHSIWNPVIYGLYSLINRRSQNKLFVGTPSKSINRSIIDRNCVRITMTPMKNATPDINITLSKNIQTTI